MHPKVRQVVRHLAQLVVIGGALFYLARLAYERRATLARVDLHLAPVPLLVASVLTLATYAYLVWTWVRSMRWWGAHLPYRPALRVWFLSNLARFIPGAVWQFAGLAALSVEAGTSPVAATGGVLLQQLVLLATGLALTLALAPGVLSSVFSIPPAVGLPLALAGLLAVALLVPLAGPVLGRATGRVFKRNVIWPMPPVGQFAAYVGGLLLPWLVYGVSFWLFGVALLGRAAPGPWVAATSFTGAYVLGILVVFAPGGLGVREAALTALLAPSIGSDRAFVLSVSSRVWLTLVEILGALAVLAIRREPAAASKPTS